MIPCEFVPAGAVKTGCWHSRSDPAAGEGALPNQPKEKKKNIVVPELFKGDDLLLLKMKSEYWHSVPLSKVYIEK